MGHQFQFIPVLFFLTLLGISSAIKYHILGNQTNQSLQLHGNEYHGNSTYHPSDHEHSGIHVAGWNFDHVSTYLRLTVFFLIMCVVKWVFHSLHCLSSKIPESCLLIITGIAIGALLIHALGDEHVAATSMLKPDFFMLILLPPIVLDSAYSLNDRVFFNNIGTILLYAGIGTILNFLLIGSTLYGLALSGAMGTISVTLVECFLFASFIVAVDPVAVLAIFQEIGVNSVLYFLVFGESLLNDAVTIVLYNTMKTFNSMETIDIKQIGLGICSFFTVSLGGLLVGLLTGIICCLMTKLTAMYKVRVVEPVVVVGMAYLSYLGGELFHWSGIISLIGCGLVQSEYVFHNISQKSKTTVVIFVRMLSTMNDCVIFLILGFQVVLHNWEWHTGFALWSVALCLIYRFISVYGLSFLANRFGRTHPISLQEQYILWYGGLRGAVCFALVATLSDSFEHKGMFISATIAVIGFTVFVQGCTIKPAVHFCKISLKHSDIESSMWLQLMSHVGYHIMGGIESIVGIHGDNYFREYLNHMSDKYLRRILQYKPWTKDEEILAKYRDITLKEQKKLLSIEHKIKVDGTFDEEVVIVATGDLNEMIDGDQDKSCFPSIGPCRKKRKETGSVDNLSDIFVDPPNIKHQNEAMFDDEDTDFEDQLIKKYQRMKKSLAVGYSAPNSRRTSIHTHSREISPLLLPGSPCAYDESQDTSHQEEVPLMEINSNDKKI